MLSSCISMIMNRFRHLNSKTTKVVIRAVNLNDYRRSCVCVCVCVFPYELFSHMVNTNLKVIIPNKALVFLILYHSHKSEHDVMSKLSFINVKRMDEAGIDDDDNSSYNESFSKNANDGSEQSTRALFVLSDHILTEKIKAHISIFFKAQIIRKMVLDKLDLDGSLFDTRQDFSESIKNIMLHIGVSCEHL